MVLSEPILVILNSFFSTAEFVSVQRLMLLDSIMNLE